MAVLVYCKHVQEVIPRGDCGRCERERDNREQRPNGHVVMAFRAGYKPSLGKYAGTYREFVTEHDKLGGRVRKDL